MNRTVAKLLPWMFIPGFHSLAAAPTLSVRVLLCDYSEAPHDVLTEAKAEVVEIYRRTGITLEWLTDSARVRRHPQTGGCEVSDTPATLIVRVLSEPMARRLRWGSTTMGVAMLPPEGRFGVIANVCAGRARKFAETERASPGTMLGHFIAHELGHLLLNDPRHTVTGIMSVRWQREEIARLKQGRLVFFREQARTIREQVLGRVLNLSPAADVRASRDR